MQKKTSPIRKAKTMRVYCVHFYTVDTTKANDDMARTYHTDHGPNSISVITFIYVQSSKHL